MDKDKIKNEFGERLKKLLKNKGIQQKEVAISLHIQRNTVSAWINGQREPTLTNLWALMEFLQSKCPNIEILKELFPDFYKNDRIVLSDKRKELLSNTIDLLTKVKSQV